MEETDKQPMYYKNKFEGEWKCQKENRYVEYQLCAFLLVIGASGVIAYWLKVNNAPQWLALPLFVVLALDFIILYAEFDLYE